jgi:hypothetical protein
MSKKKGQAIAINLRDENAKRGEIRKVINLVSELKRSPRLNVEVAGLGLPNSPVYDKYYGDEDISKGNKAVVEFNNLNDKDFVMVEEYINTNGGTVVDKRASENKNLMVLIDTSNMS